VLVDNKPGASAQIAAVAAAKARPDGYTLFMTTNTSRHSANPSLFKSLRYDPIRDFTPIVRVGELPFALAVNNDLPVRSLREFIAYVKANPASCSYATPNKHLAGRFRDDPQSRRTGPPGRALQVQPAGDDRSDGRAGAMYVADLGSGMAALRSDRVRTLGITTAAPNPMLPGHPADRADAAWVRRHLMERHLRAGGPAEAHRRAAEFGDPRGAGRAGTAGQSDPDGLSGLALQDTRGIREVRPGPARSLDRADQAGRHPPPSTTGSGIV
jgi:hypothetical protein